MGEWDQIGNQSNEVPATDPKNLELEIICCSSTCDREFTNVPIRELAFGYSLDKIELSW